MPVTFMLCADNDRGPSSAIAGLYPMLKAAGIQTEVHVYGSGGHGFGINPKTKNASPVATTWQLRLGEWPKDIGMGAGDYYPQPDAKGGWRTLKSFGEGRQEAGIENQKIDDNF